MIEPLTPMRYHQPGWHVSLDDDRLLLQVWAPNGSRAFWQAAWTWMNDEGEDLGGDCRRADTLQPALKGLRRCPVEAAADIVAALLALPEDQIATLLP